MENRIEQSMNDSLPVFNVVMAILLIGFAALYPRLTKRAKAWQEMNPRLRMFFVVGWQVFMILFATDALVASLLYVQAITIATEQSISHWTERLIVLVVIYMCVISVLARRKTKSEEKEE